MSRHKPEKRYLPPGIKVVAQAYELLADQWMYLFNGAEWKVVIFITRRTIGFGKLEDRISLTQICKGIKRHDGSQLDYGTGLSRQAAVEAIEHLEEAGMLIVVHGGYKPNTYSVNWPKVLEGSQKVTSAESSLLGRAKSALVVGQKVHPQLSVNCQPYNCQSTDDLDCPPTNGKNRHSRAGGSLSSPSRCAQHPKLRETLTQYMMEPGNGERVSPSDRQVVDVMNAAGGATEDEVIKALVYLHDKRGLRPGTGNGPHYFAWFPTAVGDYFRNKLRRDEAATPCGFQEWQGRNETAEARRTGAFDTLDKPQAAGLGVRSSASEGAR